jgi:hypothetical protein
VYQVGIAYYENVFYHDSQFAIIKCESADKRGTVQYRDVWIKKIKLEGKPE